MILSIEFVCIYSVREDDPREMATNCSIERKKHRSQSKNVGYREQSNNTHLVSIGLFHVSLLQEF